MNTKFSNILKEHNAIIYKVAKSYAYNEFEDLYQEIAIQLWRSFQSFAGGSKISTWIYKVALNTAITYKNKGKAVTVEKPIHTDGEETDNSQVLEQLYMAINKLESSQKSLIILQLEGYDYEEMSQILGISKSLVGVKLNRAKTKLKSLIKLQ